MNASQRQPTATPVEDRIEIGNRRLRVMRWLAPDGAPPAPPLLFFSGIGANAELLALFLSELRREVVTFDMPGIGGSASDGGPYRPSTMAAAAASILDRYGHAEADVMGFSWGGIIAQQFAAQHADRTRRLILAGASPGVTMVPGNPLALSGLLSPHRFGDPAFMRRHFGSIYGRIPGGDRAWPAMIQPSGKGYLYQVLALWGWSSLTLLWRIKAPTLILAGKDDDLVPPANAHILKFVIGDAQIRWIAGAGHMFLLTDREECIAAVQTFTA